MTDIRTDALADLLFGQKTELLNLKLCRGDAPQVSEEDLRDEVHFALTQVAFGRCRTTVDFPEDRAASRVDLAQFATA